MTPAEIHAAASEYMAGFDDPAPIIAIADLGTSEEDDTRLEEVYGDDATAVALEVQRQCLDRAAAKTGWTWSICDPHSGPSTWDEDDETMHETADAAADAARAAWDDTADPGCLRIVLQQWDDGAELEVDIRRL